MLYLFFDQKTKEIKALYFSTLLFHYFRGTPCEVILNKWPCEETSGHHCPLHVVQI